MTEAPSAATATAFPHRDSPSFRRVITALAWSRVESLDGFNDSVGHSRNIDINLIHRPTTLTSEPPFQLVALGWFFLSFSASSGSSSSLSSASTSASLYFCLIRSSKFSISNPRRVPSALKYGLPKYRCLLWLPNPNGNS